jgi:hypothetical protein
MHPSPVTDLKPFLPTKTPNSPRSFIPISDSPSIGATSRLQSFRSDSHQRERVPFKPSDDKVKIASALIDPKPELS